MSLRRGPRLLLAALTSAALAVGTVAAGSSPVHAAGTGNPFASRPVALDPGQAGAAAAAARARGDLGTAAALTRIAGTPQLRWVGDWVPTGRAAADVRAYASRARAAGRLPALVLYAVPHRDCGSFSAGGFATAAAYRAWWRQVLAGLGRGPAAVVVEPDAVALLDCLSPTAQRERLALLSEVVRAVTAQGATAYLDAGGPDWVPAHVMAGRLRSAGVRGGRGVALNVSNYHATDRVVAYARQLAAHLPGLHAVVDTSRNGRGAVAGEWCNVPGRALGTAPRATADPVVDALVWVKRPGESDGPCDRGEPAAGSFWVDYAVGLTR